MRVTAAAALLALLLVASDLTAGAAAVVRAPAASRHVLENGLTVVVKPSTASDLVVVEALVRAGPRLEDPTMAGATFFVRGMLVRGTDRRSADQIAQTVEGVGGLLGGGTGADFTSLYTITPSRHLDLGMEMVADLLTGARFDPRDVETQRGVGLSRIRQSADQPLQRESSELGGAAGGVPVSRSRTPPMLAPTRTAAAATSAADVASIGCRRSR